MCHCLCVIVGCLFHNCRYQLISLSPLSFRHLSSKHFLHSNQLLYYKTPPPSASTESPPTSTNQATDITNMCFKVIERYAVCRCIYYSHAVDPCPAYGRRDHVVKTREVLVGYTCSRHSQTSSQPSYNQPSFPDSGYGSGGTTQNYQGYSRR